MDYENHKSHPAPRKIILYPGEINEREILLAYGGVDSFKNGTTSCEPFCSTTDGLDSLMDLGNPILWKDAKVFRLDYKD